MMLSGLLSILLAQAMPNPAATNACLHEAAVLHAATAVYPVSVPKGVLTYAVVTVTVGPEGVVQKAVMYKSTATPDGDKEALRVARESTYTPKVVDCKPTTGVYRFRVDFAANPSATP